MQEQFVIKSESSIDCQPDELALLVGNDYFSYAIFVNDHLCELKRYYLKHTSVDQLNGILQANDALNAPFSKITTAFDYTANTLLPVDFNTGDNTPLLYLNNAGQQDHLIHEVVSDWELANIYAVPYELLNWVLTHFPSSKFWHAQSIQLKNAAKGMANGCIDLNVRDKNFSVTVTRHDQLLLAQTYCYSAPADVLFYLFKICEVFLLHQETVQLNISGLIDKQSVLYKTLYDYFLNITFKEALWQQAGEYPAHYFTLLNQVALCES